jgi:hypothetical protein
VTVIGKRQLCVVKCKCKDLLSTSIVEKSRFYFLTEKCAARKNSALFTQTLKILVCAFLFSFIIIIIFVKLKIQNVDILIFTSDIRNDCCRWK